MVKLLCPKCREPPPSGATACPEHGLFALPREALAKLSRAPLLGLILNDRYALVGYIGGGGMGMVYLAQDIRLGRKVAIKILRQAMSMEPTDRKRFEVEARALSKLRSVNTVTVHDFGMVHEAVVSPLAFMVMEHVDGVSLGQRIREGPLPLDMVIDIVSQMGRSLDEAHAVDIIHRDIKPGNVLLTQTPGGELQVKVVDFGIARMDGDSPTQTGCIVGTPQYMAPEQCVAARELDGRVDVYQTAVMTFEMLTGRRPFVAENAIQILSMHVSAPPPPIAGPTSDPIWEAIEVVVHRGMAKTPAERHPTVGAFARALREAVGEVETRDTLPPTVVRDSVPPVVTARRRRWQILAGLVFLTGCAFAYLASRQPPAISSTDAEVAVSERRDAAPADTAAVGPDAAPAVILDAAPMPAVDATRAAPADRGVKSRRGRQTSNSRRRCGDRRCQPERGENCHTCRTDCGCKTDMVCASNGRCILNIGL